jgi:hypothetical protein
MIEWKSDERKNSETVAEQEPPKLESEKSARHLRVQI